MTLEKNIVREIRKISDEKQINFMDVWKTYYKLLEEIEKESSKGNKGVSK